MMSGDNGDGVRLMAWLYARTRHRAIIEAGGDAATAQAQFREWCVGADEGDTGGYAKVAVAALLGEMRLEGGAR